MSGVVRRRVALAIVIAGATGMVAAIIGVVVGWQLMGDLTATIDETSRLTADALNTVAESVEVAQQALADIETGLATAEEMLSGAGGSIEEVGGVVEDAAGLLGTSVADGIESVSAAMPGLISTAAVLNGALRALATFGVDYDPEVPLDEALQDLDTSLDGLPAQLRDQAARLEALVTESGQLSGQVGDLAGVVGDLSGDVAAAESVLDDYAATAEEAVELLETRQADLDSLQLRGRLMVVALGAALAIALGGVAALGWTVLADERTRE